MPVDVSAVNYANKNSILFYSTRNRKKSRVTKTTTTMAAADAEVADTNYKFIKHYTFPVKDIPHLSINDEEAIRKIDANVLLLYYLIFSE